MCFINKMDRVGADFDRTVAMIRDRLEANPAVIQLPIGAEGGFEGVVDLLKMKALVWGEGMGETWETRDIPAHLLAERRGGAPRTSSTSSPTSTTTSWSATWPTRRSPPTTFARRCARPRSRARSSRCCAGPPSRTRPCSRCWTPSSTTCPARSTCPRPRALPQDGRAITREHRDDEPFSSLAFKIMSDPFVGKLTYLRVYSGTFEKGTTVMNSSRDRKERIGRILQMHANHREDREAVYTGDIVAVVGLKSTTTGDTLCDVAHPIVLESLEFPEPVIHVAVEPKTKADQDKLSRALFALSEEDPTFRVRRTTRPARRSSPAWASCTSRCSSTGCCASSRSTPTSASPRLPTGRPSAKRPQDRGALRSPDRRPRPVRPRRDRPRADRARRGLRVRRQGDGRSDPEGVHPRRRRRHPGGDELGRARRLPDRRRPGHADLRLLPRRRLLRDGLQDRRLDGLQKGRPAAHPALLEPIMEVEVVTPKTTSATSSAICRPAGAGSRAWSSGARAMS